MTTPDLVSLVVTVRPSEPVSVPGYLGRAVHALLLRWLDETDPALARQWHDADGPKPYTCSSLIGSGRMARDGSRQLAPERTYWLRLTALDQNISAALLARQDNPPASIELDRQALSVESITADPDKHAWAATARYEELAAPYLLARQKAPRRLRLRFTSPVSFRQRELNVPLPLPGLVFGGLADRWNAFSPVALAPEVRRYAEECVALSSFSLRSRALPVKGGGIQVGAVGETGYVAVSYDRYWMSMLGLLADYALFAGVGRMATSGLGQARRVER